jgi:hypothetical protein
MTKSLSEIVPLLQVAVGPVILISGVGLLLLSLTNRFARILDRARLLARELKNPASAHHAENLGLIRMLHRRALWLRASIALASMSVLFASVLIILLFIQALLGGSSALLVVCAFVVCLLSLIGSVIAFIWDIHLSMVTLKLELGPALESKSRIVVPSESVR